MSTKIKDEVLNEIQMVWPTVVQTRTRILSSTFRKLSFLQRRLRESSSLSSSLTNTNSTMQQCWPTCEPEFSIDKINHQQALTPCEHCFEPTEPVLISDIFNVTRERQCSQPVSVPDSPTIGLINSQQQPQPQSHSSGYESAFGNGLSPTANSWTFGLNDLSSRESSVCEELPNEEDQSIYDESSTTDGADEQDIDDDSFEVLSFEAPPESTLYIKEFQHTTSNSQNNVCGCCNIPFTSIPNSSARRCYYFGKLYCSRCHIMDYAYIPAKILKSFDMQLYPVCRRAKSILQLNFYQPMFDIQNDNENLYQLIPILSEIKNIRIQFKHFYAYLSTCPRLENQLGDKFFKDFYARDYLYQSIHSYSVHDLLSLKKILQTLHSASVRAKQHIYQCGICREKGFTCEICKNRRDILYPFDDMKTIGQCQRCSNIYHRRCYDRIEHDCPKCYRLIQRKREQNVE